MPLASLRSVRRSPVSVEPVKRHVSQSCGRHTAAVASAWSGSLSASQRSFVAVMAATGTTPIRFAHSSAPPSSATNSPAASLDRVSFQSRASRTTSPAPSRHTMPCCWAPTDTAATSSSPPAEAMLACRADHQCRGSTSVPSGWGDDADRTVSPVSASQITTLHDWVDESIPATSATPERYPDGFGRTARTSVHRTRRSIKTADQRRC